jgi:hypothetical protein
LHLTIFGTMRLVRNRGVALNATETLDFS